MTQLGPRLKRKNYNIFDDEPMEKSSQRSKLSLRRSNAYESDQIPEGAKDYKNAIKSLRNPTSGMPRIRKERRNNSFRVLTHAERESRDIDDWLEDDLQHKKKKRRTQENCILEAEPPEEIMEIPDEKTEIRDIAAKTNETLESTNFDSSVSQDGSYRSVTNSRTQKVTVEVSGKKFLIPIPNNSTDKVMDLVKNVAQRYEKKEGTRPILRLVTKDGAEVSFKLL